MSDSADLPIRRLTFYQHGVALLEREGRFDGDTLTIDVRDEDLEHALKSLIVRDRAGVPICVGYETPAVASSDGDSLELSAGGGMLDLLERLTGWQVRVELAGGTELVEGRVVGLQYAKEHRWLHGATLMLFDSDTGALRALPVELLTSIVPREPRFGDKLQRFLDAGKLGNGSSRITVRLPTGAHELRVSYLVRAPAWQVNYRVIAQSDAPERGTLLLQGWAQLDKRFDEDLDGVQVTLVVGQAGDGCAYQVPGPVSVPRGSSALLPILSAKLAYRRELLFNADSHSEHPVAALHCANTSGLALEQGSATLFEDGRYRGQAILPFTGRERQLYLPYAVEPLIDVSVGRDFVLEEGSLRIDGGLLFEQGEEIRSFSYRIVNRSDTDRLVTVECNAGSLPGALFESPPPASRANGVLRWEVSCPAHGVAILELRTRKPVERAQTLVEMRPQRLGELLKTAGLAPSMRRALELLRGELGRIEENEQQSAALDGQRKRLFARQGHLRRNIGALAVTGDEGEVRLKMVRELQAAEGALSGIEQLLGELTEDSDLRRKALPSKLRETAGEAERSLS